LLLQLLQVVLRLKFEIDYRACELLVDVSGQSAFNASN
jgi:hypothetical protein